MSKADAFEEKDSGTLLPAASSDVESIERVEEVERQMQIMKIGGPGPINIATISAGFEKGDFLVREAKGHRVYFDFFEEAFNYIANRGYSRMKSEEETEWIDTMNAAHSSIKGGTKYNTGKLLVVLSRPLFLQKSGEGRSAEFVSSDTKLV